MCHQDQSDISLEAICKFLNYQGVIYVRAIPDISLPESPMAHHTVSQSGALSIS
ncbi:MAG: hypothetical protein ACFFE8_12425 [Candidatus Heimdallarchaeota archaeon]